MPFGSHLSNEFPNVDRTFALDFLDHCVESDESARAADTRPGTREKKRRVSIFSAEENRRAMNDDRVWRGDGRVLVQIEKTLEKRVAVRGNVHVFPLGVMIMQNQPRLIFDIGR